MHKNIILVVIAILLGGCSTKLQTPAPATLHDTGDPALHALQNERLRELMVRMNRLVFEQIRTEIEIDQDRRHKALRIAEVAGELQQSADAIIAARASLNLGQSESTAFIALATKLKGQAIQLESLARHNQIEALPEVMMQITNTCTACHSLFRKL